MRRALALAVALLTLTLAGCSDAPAAQDAIRTGPPSAVRPTHSTDPGQAHGERYVALGDSFTSGPLVPTTDLAGGCFRSDHNYPSLLAKRLDVRELVDVSCAGARTRDLTHPQPTVRDAQVPPQLRALSRSTTLVTLGIGGNDFDLFERLTDTCLRLRDSDPTGSPCRTAFETGDAPVRGSIDAIGRHVEDALHAVQQRAPRARVVLVGYLRVAPAHGTCPSLLPYADGDVVFGDEVLRRINEAMRGAAERAGVDFLDMYARSAGHDVCSDDPYVNGVVTDRQRAAAFHPFLRGMKATASALEDLLASD